MWRLTRQQCRSTRGSIALVTAISSVLLPAAALAHTAGSTHTVAKYYLRGTIASLALLAIAAIVVWLVAAEHPANLARR